MKEEYIKLLGEMTYGIYVLTSAADQVINGMIASWVSQVSYDPLLLMVAIHPNRYTHDLIDKSGCFALNVISKSQKEYLHRFKGPDPKLKFSSVEWGKGITGDPILTDCIGYMECRIKKTLVLSIGNNMMKRTRRIYLGIKYFGKQKRQDQT